MSERKVVIEDLEVLEALAPDDHSLRLLNREIQCGPLPLKVRWGMEILKI